MAKTKMIPISEPSLGALELKYVTDCVKSGWVSSLGAYIEKFEQAFASFIGTPYGVSVFNGTVALHLALVALDIGPNDEVIVPSLTFIATANAVLYTGATPIFVDSEADTWNMDPIAVEKKITSKTKAMIIVHLYGHPAKLQELLRIAKKYHLKVIEDAAESHGAEYRGQKVGSFGDVGCFSFYGNKIITTGEGGMAVTKNKKLADKMRFLKDHAMNYDRKYYHPVLGFNYRMTNLQAALGLAQMSKIDSFIKQKQKIARFYNQGLENVAGIVQPPQFTWATNVYWMYSILVTPQAGITRNDLATALKAKGIDSRPFFIPNHQMPYLPTKTQRLKLPVAERLSNQGINLPSSVLVTEAQVKYIVKSIKEVLANS